MHFDIDYHTITLMVSGSHAYGMGTSASDVDIRGVCIPPHRVRESYYLAFEQWSSTDHVGPWGDRSRSALDSIAGTAKEAYERTGQALDVTIMSLTKFIALAANANPSILELLFIEGESLLLTSGPFMQLQEHRELFLSQKCLHTYSGYAHAQLKKIRTHRERLPTVSRENRNAARLELEAKYGYDCYADDTRFLTEAGWKAFDDIGPQDKLATVHLGDMAHRPFGRVEYQAPTERFCGSFTGSMYHFTGHHTDVLVTPNHRMLYRKVSRRKGETYGTVLEEAASMPDTFDFLRTVTPRSTRYSMRGEFGSLPIKPEVFMRLMGWYLSDGCAYRKRGKLSAIRISQKRGGRLHREMSRFHNRYESKVGSRIYTYPRKTVGGNALDEVVLAVTEKDVCRRIAGDCGTKKQKRLPRWVFGLSKRMMEILFDAMCGGDGTVRKTSKRSWVYYTTLPGLADDVNELAVLCGWESSLWGPYKNTSDLCPEGIMYQVHVDKKAKQFQRFVRRSISKVPVENQRIVCFTVPNGTLITRRNGRVAIHGNSKHASHMMRLMRTGTEILRDGVLRVRRPDAEDLLAIRNGAYTYEQLIEMADSEEAQMRAAAAKSKLPWSPRAQEIDPLLLKILKEDPRAT